MYKKINILYLLIINFGLYQHMANDCPYYSSSVSVKYWR